MNKDYTHIALVIDRSGSMERIKDEAQGGVNGIIEDQKKEEGKTTLSLSQFDTVHDSLHDFRDINDVPTYTLEPRGMTALYDAIGTTIKTVGEKLAALPEEERPGLVLFNVVTDGMENSSREYNRDDIRKMIETQSSVFNWQFNFLGASQASVTQAQDLGFKENEVEQFTSTKIGNAYGALNAKMSRMRGQSKGGQAVVNTYTAEEKSSMK